MQIRRRCRRYCLGRLIIYFLLLIATSSTIIFSYNFYSNIFLSENSERHKIYYIDESDLEEARIKPTENVRFLREDFFNTSKIMCRYPKLAIDNPEVWKHLNPVKQSRPDCEKSTNWVYVENGLFLKGNEIGRIRDDCCCRCFFKEHFDYLNRLYKNMDQLFVLIGLFFDRKMIFPQWKVLVYFLWWTKCHLSRISFVLIVEHVMEVSIQIFTQALCSMLVYICGKFQSIECRTIVSLSLVFRHVWNPMVKTHLGYNVLMFGFDSVSRMTFMRFLPKSYSYLIKELGTIVMKGRRSSCFFLQH